ncbi:MAG TPA: hypothetical protein VI911_09975 [Patescibacteria group bacterium]|nr:hypothetical protein [Patescibacteria group bacterium]
MKKTINKRGNPGMLCVDGRPDRTKAPLIKQTQSVKTKIIPSPSKASITVQTTEPLKFVTVDEPGTMTINTKPDSSGYIKRRRN